MDLNSQETISQFEKAPCCSHCGTPLSHYYETAEINSEKHHYCCVGCLRVAEFIHHQKLDYFYSIAKDSLQKPPPISLFDWHKKELSSAFIRQQGDQTFSIELKLTGLRCTACAWLIEHALKDIPGLIQFNLQYEYARLYIQWNPTDVELTKITDHLLQCGYASVPLHSADAIIQRKTERQQALRRLSVAGLGMMQVMMYAVALYIGNFQFIESEFFTLFRWISWIICTPVLFYSGLPILMGAWRGIKARKPGMDVPVSTALIWAYTYSVWSTLHQGTEIYFDSVTMFVFFLSCSRYLEMSAHHASQERITNILQSFAPLYLKIVDGISQEITRASIQKDDYLIIKAGQEIPVDGVLKSNEALLDCALLTGESNPVKLLQGSNIPGGAFNSAHSFEMLAENSAIYSRLSTMEQLAQNTLAQRVNLPPVIDIIARYFSVTVLTTAFIIYNIWLQIDSDRAMAITLSMLVATCPCALSIASPAVTARWISALARMGLLTKRMDRLNLLHQLKTIVFDKTGTLTLGRPVLRGVRAYLFSAENNSAMMNVQIKNAIIAASSLEFESAHPIAHAFKNFTAPQSTNRIETIQGIEGLVLNKKYYIGSKNFIAQHHVGIFECVETLSSSSYVLVNQDLASLRQTNGTWNTDQNTWQTSIYIFNQTDNELFELFLEDPLRDGAKSCVKNLHAQELELHLFSGDQRIFAEPLANTLCINNVQAEITPEEKQKLLEKLPRPILMLGDGNNDSLACASADIAIAMASGSDLTKSQADLICTKNTLDFLPHIIELSRKADLIKRQNWIWAIGYNLSVLPIAAMGWIPPYIAALGMSLSSLLVVLNTLRLRDPYP
ncbi:MAG: cation-translocating P-type ATPase [Pseudomonadota bacterium]